MTKILTLLSILLLISCATPSNTKRSLASLSKLNGYWTQVRSGCNLNLTSEEVLDSLKKNEFMSISSGALDLQDGIYNIYYSSGKACDPNSNEIRQYVADMNEYAYCGKKLHNRGSYDETNGLNNYYFKGEKIAYTRSDSLGMGLTIKVYNLQLLTPMILKSTYTGSKSCKGIRTLYYIAIPS